mgnify:CR=1 FL=1
MKTREKVTVLLFSAAIVLLIALILSSAPVTARTQNWINTDFIWNTRNAAGSGLCAWR